jgi:hypothetical protein
MRTLALLPALLAFGLAAAGTARAADQGLPPPARPAAERPDYSGYAKGAAFTSRGESYVVLPELRAVQAASLTEATPDVLSRVGIPGAPVLERKGVHVLVRQPAPGLQHAALAALPGGVSRPVVLNTRTNQLGIVLGTLIVKLRNPADSDALGEAHGVTIVARFDHLATTVYAVRAGADVAAAARALQADPRVEAADVEVLERVARPL